MYSNRKTSESVITGKENKTKVRENKIEMWERERGGRKREYARETERGGGGGEVRGSLVT